MAETAGAAGTGELPGPAVPGVVLGVGLGGFVDGIVLHQILRWHNMLSSTERWPPTTLANLEANMLADGLFHAATWVAVTAGIWLLWRTLRRNGGLVSGRALVGWMLVGWGAFNLVEGLVNHHALGLHHVRGEPHLGWDLGFLVFGAALVVGGRLLARSEGRRGDGSRA